MRLHPNLADAYRHKVAALRDALHEVLEDECTDVLVTIITNLETIINKYANSHAVQSYNPADYADLEVKPIQPPK